MAQSEVKIAPLTVNEDDSKPRGITSGPLAVAGIAGVLASACCIGPLVLASIGLGSIVASIVALFEPLRPVLIVVAMAALGFARWKIYRRPIACAPGSTCASPQTDRVYRGVFWVIAVVVLALITFPYYIALFY